MKILIASPIFPETIETLREEHDVVCAFDASTDELKRVIHDREVLIFRSGVDINASVMACSPHLKLLVRAGSGLDNVDMNYVEAHGLELRRIELPGAKAVAELAFAFMLNLARQVRRADALLRKGHWAKHKIKGHLLTGNVLGVYGAGNIGALVGEMGAAWGMEVLGCIEHPTAERADALRARGIKLTEPEELLARSDYVSLHVPLKSSTRRLFDAAQIARMKPGAFLVNLTRGGVVDEAALRDALLSGHLTGAGTDVHAKEGEGHVSPLADLDNVILTPHIGAGTIDSQREIGETVLEIIKSRIG